MNLSLSRAQQADGDETYFIMKTNGRVILRKAEIVLSRQVSSTVVALSCIHELFLGNEGLVEVSVQRTKNSAAAIESTMTQHRNSDSKEQSQQAEYIDASVYESTRN
jgi:hypothetical protein